MITRDIEDRVDKNTKGLKRVDAEVRTKVSKEEFDKLASRVDQLELASDKNVFITDRNIFSKYLNIFIDNETCQIYFDGIGVSCDSYSSFCVSLISLRGAFGCYVP